MRAITYRGLQVHIGTRAEFRTELGTAFTGNSQKQVVTLNPEFVVLATRNPDLVALTQRAGLCVVDGIGLALALRQFGHLERYPGADMVPDLLDFCAKNQRRVGVILTHSGLSTPSQVVATLIRLYPGLRLEAWDEADAHEQSIQHFSPELLLVTFGQPRQDFWIAEHLQALPSVRVAIGVGGAVDFLTGARRRAPRVMRVLGLEWLWRLITQPQRFLRILRATFGFWYTILFR